MKKKMMIVIIMNNNNNNKGRGSIISTPTFLSQLILCFIAPFFPGIIVSSFRCCLLPPSNHFIQGFFFKIKKDSFQ